MFLPRDVGHRTVIHRTVMGVIETALAATAEGKKVYWVGGIDAYQINELQDIYWYAMAAPDRVRNKNSWTISKITANTRRWLKPPKTLRCHGP